MNVVKFYTCFSSGPVCLHHTVCTRWKYCHLYFYLNIQIFNSIFNCYFNPFYFMTLFHCNFILLSSSIFDICFTSCVYSNMFLLLILFSTFYINKTFDLHKPNANYLPVHYACSLHRVQDRGFSPSLWDSTAENRNSNTIL